MLIRKKAGTSRTHGAFLVLALLISTGGLTVSAHAASPTLTPPSLHVPYAGVVPQISGASDDPAWKSAASTADMTVSRGAAAQGLTALPTRAYLLWDAKNLYIRFVCLGGSMETPYKKHDDPLYHADAVEVFIDPKGDGREWVELEVSPHNVVFDQLAVLTAEPEYEAGGILTHQVLDRDWWTDLSWNLEGLRTAAGRLQSRGKITGWIVDMAVPATPLLRRLGVKSFGPMNLRVNLLRYETMTAADGKPMFIPMNWAPVTFGCPHILPDAMGTLVLDPPTTPQK